MQCLAWIERLFDFAPDGGNGSLEAALLLATTGMLFTAAVQLRRVAERRLVKRLARDRTRLANTSDDDVLDQAIARIHETSDALRAIERQQCRQNPG